MPLASINRDSGAIFSKKGMQFIFLYLSRSTFDQFSKFFFFWKWLSLVLKVGDQLRTLCAHFYHHRALRNLQWLFCCWLPSKLKSCGPKPQEVMHRQQCSTPRKMWKRDTLIQLHGIRKNNGDNWMRFMILGYVKFSWFWPQFRSFNTQMSSNVLLDHTDPKLLLQLVSNCLLRMK